MSDRAVTAPAFIASAIWAAVCQACLCLQGWEQAAAALIKLRHYDGALKTLHRLKQMELEQGVTRSSTSQLLQQAEQGLALQPMNAYLVLGVPADSNALRVSPMSCTAFRSCAATASPHASILLLQCPRGTCHSTTALLSSAIVTQLEQLGGNCSLRRQ